MPLLVRVVDVLVLLRLVVLPGVVVNDAPGDVDAVGGDANGEGVVGPAVPLALVLAGVVCAVAVVTPGWEPVGWRWWCLSASPAGVFGDADGDSTFARRWWGWWWCG